MMSELLLGGGLVIGGLVAGMLIYRYGLRQGADIVWKVSGDRPSLFEPPTGSLDIDTAEEMESEDRDVVRE